MGLLNFFRKPKKTELQNTVDEIYKDLFPNGEKDLKTGIDFLLQLTSNKLSYKEARLIYIKSFSLSKISKDFSIERLTQHLNSQPIKCFSKKQIEEYFVFLMKQNGINVHLLSNDEYYEKMFQSLLDEFNFFYPEIITLNTSFDFFTDNGKIIVQNDNQIGLISSYSFNWLRYVYTNNKVLHKKIVTLFSDKNTGNYFELKSQILKQFRHKDKDINAFLESEKNTLELYRILSAYNVFIDKSFNSLLNVYKQDKINVELEIRQLNNNFLPSKQINDSSNLSVYDICSIFLRDVLSGEKLQ
jgi:hypothetical protein